jgi:RNA polymerase sigma-70 factor (ECF subfamily)
MESDALVAEGPPGPLAAPAHGVRFEDFFELEYDGLLGAMYLVTGDRHEAEDLTQDAFSRVFERWGRVSRVQSPAGYLYRTAMNAFRSRRRRAAVAARRMVHLLAPREPFEDVEVREDVRRALASLTPRQRAALVLTESLGYPPLEAAGILGIRPSTVRALTTQARATLRRELGGDDG